ncbi:hypothetical protein CLOM_g13040 [Closterium sp. NIES-68]|nr:hypothetical protein CLOM_g13040 [Closterium sp. NIES-68]
MAVKTLAACSKADPDDLFYWEEDHGSFPAGLKSLYLPAASASASPTWSHAAGKRSTPAAAAAPLAKKARISDDDEDEFSYMSEWDLLEFRQRYTNPESNWSSQGNVSILTKDEFLSSTGKKSPWILVNNPDASKKGLNTSNRSVMICSFSSSGASSTTNRSAVQIPAVNAASTIESGRKKESKYQASQKKPHDTAAVSSQESARNGTSRQQGAQGHAAACRVGRIHEDEHHAKQLSRRSPGGPSPLRKASAAVVPVDTATAASGSVAPEKISVKVGGKRRMRRWVSRVWSSIALNKWHNGK